jgi:multidrug efflux pump subunit AcrA (membrane-fusion protein)
LNEVPEMTDDKRDQETAEAEQPRKMTQAEAAKRLLAQKKQAQTNAAQGHQAQGGGTKMMKSQNTKKINNQRKRMGV